MTGITMMTAGAGVPGPATAHQAPARPRVQSLDIIRGAVMVLMAIDHVRVFSGVPPGGPTAAVFFTRWFTHFCAPAFVFLAGTSAFLYGCRIGNRDQLSRFLFTRGVWLIVLELTVLRFGWTFNLDYRSYLLAGVIWVIGWCLVLMAAITRLPVAWVAAIGATIVAFHDLIGLSVGDGGGTGPGWLAQLLYFGGPIQIGGADGPTLAVLYSLIPWIGVMALGYAFGAIVQLDPARRRRLCLAIGLVAIGIFAGLRAFNLYGDPRPWTATGSMPAFLSFLNTTKYPASLLFLLMTLGPTIALVPLLETARGRLADALALFGRVPFFFYLLHLPLIHLLAIGVTAARNPADLPWLFDNHPMMNGPGPEGFRWSLPLLYGVWALAVGILYLPCRWFAALKARNRSRWLSYL